MKQLWVFAILFLAATLAFAGGKDKSSDLTIKVLKEANGKPVRNAAVILHAVNSSGKQESGGVNLKTDPEGITTYSGIPYGKVRVQVIVHGYQTYGEDFDIDQPQKEIVVKMKPPQKQYSIYEHGAGPADIDPDKKK